MIDYGYTVNIELIARRTEHDVSGTDEHNIESVTQVGRCPFVEGY